jgi:large subunit ribosomal protein L5|uniref:Ribosomal protein L5 n=1 Tax=Thalassiosira profunda TaxID=376140 RepID=A0A7T3V3H6_9STRA|nr:ribosomal protein L5 [Thalassiosira profunda]QPZ94119.1 ribosomal protein L5 [Thalassiosira profunda]
MFFFETYFHKAVKYDLINTFFCQNLAQVPKLKKIVLNFGYQKSNFKYFASSLLALEFISSKKGKLTKSRHVNVFLKIKKGNPVGCKIIFKRSAMYFFYLKLKAAIASKVKQSRMPQLQQNVKSVKSVSFQLENPQLFAELESQFQFFNEIPRLDITLVTNSRSRKELFFLLKSIKFFL